MGHTWTPAGGHPRVFCFFFRSLSAVDPKYETRRRTSSSSSTSFFCFYFASFFLNLRVADGEKSPAAAVERSSSGVQPSQTQSNPWKNPFHLTRTHPHSMKSGENPFKPIRNPVKPRQLGSQPIKPCGTRWNHEKPNKNPSKPGQTRSKPSETK